MAIPPATACETDVTALRKRVNYLRGDNESLRERVAELLAYNQTRTDEIAASVAHVAAMKVELQGLRARDQRFSLREPAALRSQLAAAQEQVAALRQQSDELLAAAQAVIDRWDTPLWKGVPATAEFINELRAAVARVKP